MLLCAENIILMKKSQFTQALSILLLLGTLLIVSNQYALQGEWKLVNQKDINLDSSLQISFEFAKKLDVNSTISRSLIVHACYNLAYSYSVRQNSLLLEFQNIIDIPRKCQSGEITTIRSKIDTIFYFALNGSSLRLFDPTGFAPFVFQRVDTGIPNINGAWKTLTVNYQSINQQIKINGSHAILCDGNGLAIYNVSSHSQLVFTILKSKGCSKDQMSILIALDSSTFFRMRNSSFLYLYDYKLNNIFYAFQEGYVAYRQDLLQLLKPDEQVPTVLYPSPPTKNQQNAQNSQKKVDQVSNVTQPIIKIPDAPLANKQISKNDTNNTKQESQQSSPSNISSNAAGQDNQQPPKNMSRTNSTIDIPKVILQPVVQNPLKLIISPQPIMSDIAITPAVIVKQAQNKTQDFSSSRPSNQTGTEKIAIPPISNNNPNLNSSIKLDISLSTTAPPSPQPVSNLSSTSFNNSVVAKPNPPTLSLTTNQAGSQGSKVQQKIPDPKSKSDIIQLPKLTLPVVKQPASQADLSPVNSSIDGKWFIARMGSNNVADFKSYYFIISSSNKRIIMYGGCNVNFSSFNLNGNQISFTGAAGTKKACLNDNDKQVIDPLLRSASYLEVSQGLLFFYDSKLAESIVLTTTPPSS